MHGLSELERMSQHGKYLHQFMFVVDILLSPDLLAACITALWDFLVLWMWNSIVLLWFNF